MADDKEISATFPFESRFVEVEGSKIHSTSRRGLATRSSSSTATRHRRTSGEISSRTRPR